MSHTSASPKLWFQPRLSSQPRVRSEPAFTYGADVPRTEGRVAPGAKHILSVALIPVKTEVERVVEKSEVNTYVGSNDAFQVRLEETSLGMENSEILFPLTSQCVFGLVCLAYCLQELIAANSFVTYMTIRCRSLPIAYNMLYWFKVCLFREAVTGERTRGRMPTDPVRGSCLNRS